MTCTTKKVGKFVPVYTFNGKVYLMFILQKQEEMSLNNNKCPTFKS